MFYFEEFNGVRVLKSSLLNDVKHCFTTRLVDMNVLGGNVISPEQVHSDNVEVVDSRMEYPATDGLILTKPNVSIALKFADCTPIMLYDSKNNIGAVVHAGWRGTLLKIGVKTLKIMQTQYGTCFLDVIAVIGPAIGMCCYEVSMDVKEKVLSTIKDKSGLYYNNRIDLKKINARQFEEIGVEKIDISPYCTSCNNDLFYSYRKENGTFERHYAIMKLNFL